MKEWFDCGRTKSKSTPLCLFEVPGASQYLLTTKKDKVFSVSVEGVRRTINRDDFAAEGAIRRST
jgi:hypothetical protein